MYIRGIDEKRCGENCEECTLNQEPYVPGYGPDKADIVLVGEAPGKEEFKKGRPFVGRSGQLLDEMLEYAGIDRDNVYITNTVLCHPPGNRDPYASEMKLCADRLKTEILSREPSVIVPMGNKALKAMLGEQKISKKRGTLRYSKEFGDIIPTFHPAAALYTGGRKRQIRTDFRMVARFLERGRDSFQTPVAHYSLTKDPNQLRIKASGASRVVVDIENDSQGQVLCVGLKFDHDDVPTVIPRLNLVQLGMRDTLAEILNSLNVVGHRLDYDIRRLWETCIDIDPLHDNLDDTLLMAYAMDQSAYSNTRGLKRLVSDFFGFSYGDEIQTYIHRMEDCPPDLMYKYNSLDVVCTEMVLEELEEILTEQQLEMYRTRLMPGLMPITEMEYNGVKIDIEALHKTQTQLGNRVDELEEEMFELAGREFNPRSPKQVCTVLYDELEVPIPGERATSDELLEKVEKYHPIVEKLRSYRGVQKLYSTYAVGLEDKIDDDGLLHTRFNIDGTRTGRLSSAGPNLQNIPKRSEDGRKIKRTFVPFNHKKIFIEADLSQAELRCLAYYSRDENLIDAFEEGEDIHTRTASLVFGVAMDEVTEHQRNIAKTINFAILYGSGPTNIANLANCTVDEAKEAIRNWFLAYPGAAKWMEETGRKGYQQGYVETPTGRRREFPPGLPHSTVSRRAANTPIQCLAWECTLEGIVDIYTIKHQENIPLNLLLTVHDSVLIEADEVGDPDIYEDVVWIKRKMEKAAERIIDNVVPFRVDIAIGYNWADMVEIEPEELLHNDAYDIIKAEQ